MKLFIKEQPTLQQGTALPTARNFRRYSKVGRWLCLLPLFLLSCSGSDSDSEVVDPVAPAQQEIAPGNDARPAWQAPTYTAFEQTMSVSLLMQRELETYVTQQDLLCATVGDEVRGLTAPTIEEGLVFFPLTVAGRGKGESITLSYYCDRLHRIFSIPWTTFDASMAPMGEDGIYRPKFVSTN